MTRRAFAILCAKSMFSTVKIVFKSYCFPHKQMNFISLQAFGVISVLDFGHSSRYRVILIEFAWTYDVGHVFICLFAVSISSLMRCPLRSLVHFNWVVFLLLNFKSSLFIFDKKWVICKNFLTVCSLSSNSLDIYFTTHVFNLNEVQLINYFFRGVYRWYLSKNMSPYPRSSRFSPILFSRSFIALHFTFKSMINFELIFVKRYKVHV